MGSALAPVTPGLPASQHLPPAEVASLASVLANIEPEALAPHYAAVTLDAAEIYPACWVRWEETFDPLGQLIEHFQFLRGTSSRTSDAGDALLLAYEDDGDRLYDDETS